MPSAVIRLQNAQDEKPAIESNFTEDQQYCHDLYEEYRTSTYRDRKLNEIWDGRRRFDKDIPVKDFPFEGCSNKTMGLEEIAVTQLEPRIMAQLVGENNFIQPVPVGPEDQAQAEYVKKISEWLFTNNLKLKQSLRPIVRNLLLDGTAFIIPLWQETTKLNKIRVPVPSFVTPDGQPVEIPQEYQQPQILAQMGIVQNGWKDDIQERQESMLRVVIDPIPISDCFCPDTGDNWDEQPFLRFIYPTYADLVNASDANGGPYFDIDESIIDSNGRRGEDERDENQDDKDIEQSEYTGQIRCIECYIKWEGVWRLQTYTENGFRQIRDQKISDIYPHGRKPVHRLAINKDPNESLGNGIPNLIKFYSTGVDDLYNVMIDAAMVDVCFQGFLEEGPGATAIDRDMSVGKYITIPKGTVPHISPKTGIQAVQLISFINLLMSFFERTVSLLDATLPGGGGARGGRGTDTYSGMALIQAEANVALGYEGEGLRDTLEAVLTDCFELYAFYLPTDFKMRIFENDQWNFQPVDVMALQGAYDVKLNVSDTTANQMLNRAEAMEMIQAFSGVPFFNMIKGVEDALKTYNKANPQEYIDPNYQFVMQAMQQIPNLPQMIQQLIQQQGMGQEDQELREQAFKNVRRQDIQREVEDQTGAERRKIVDQVEESVMREALRPSLEAQARQNLVNQGGVEGIMGGVV